MRLRPEYAEVRKTVLASNALHEGGRIGPWTYDVQSLRSGGGKQAPIVRKQLVGVDTRCAREMDRVKRVDSGRRKIPCSAKQLSTYRNEHVRPKQPVDLFAYRLARVRQCACTRDLDECEPAGDQDGITSEVMLQGRALGFLASSLPHARRAELSQPCRPAFGETKDSSFGSRPFENVAAAAPAAKLPTEMLYPGTPCDSRGY